MNQAHLCESCCGQVHIDATAEGWLRLPQELAESVPHATQALSRVLLNALSPINRRPWRHRRVLVRTRWGAVIPQVLAVGKNGDRQIDRREPLTQFGSYSSIQNWLCIDNRLIDARDPVRETLCLRVKVNSQDRSGDQGQGANSVRLRLLP